MAVAKHNGWQSIRVHGSDEFKKAVYLEAARSGVEVKGFKPSEQLKLEGERLAARDKDREAQDPAKRTSMAKQDPTESRAAAEKATGRAACRERGWPTGKKSVVDGT